MLLKGKANKKIISNEDLVQKLNKKCFVLVFK